MFVYISYFPDMSIDRSTNLFILSIEHEYTKKINLDKVIENLQKLKLENKTLVFIFAKN